MRAAATGRGRDRLAGTATMMDDPLRLPAAQRIALNTLSVSVIRRDVPTADSAMAAV